MICYHVSGHREQMNTQTAFIDGSMIYGSDRDLAWELRTHRDGLLLTSGEHRLPEQDELESQQSVYTDCVKSSPTEGCFKAGMCVCMSTRNTPETSLFRGRY